MVGSDALTAGPTARDPRRLAEELRLLAADARVAVHRGALEELAGEIGTPELLARWSGTDLAGIYADQDMFLDVPPGAGSAAAGAAARGPDRRWAVRRERWARTLAGSTGVLVFLPLLVTWAGLGAAAWSYQRMRDTGKGGGESFLALWQQGFDGHLWPVFHFDVMVAHTVLALGGLITAAALRQRQEHADDASVRLFAARLAGALAQVQTLAAQAAQTEPLRFARELQEAAADLRALGELAAALHKESRDLIAQARRTSALTRSAAEALSLGVTGLRTAASAVETSASTASRAARDAGKGAEVLSAEVTRVMDDMGREVREAARTAAGELTAAAGEAAARIGTAAGEAAAREESAARRGAELLDRTAEAMGGNLGSARASLESAAGELAGVVGRLDGTVAALPEALGSSAADGADRIGWAYDQAVLALATGLREDAEAVSAELAARLAQSRELARRWEEAEDAARRSRAETEDGLRSGIAEFREALRRVVAGIEESAGRGAVPDSMPVPVPVPGASAAGGAAGGGRVDPGAVDPSPLDPGRVDPGRVDPGRADPGRVADGDGSPDADAGPAGSTAPGPVAAGTVLGDRADPGAGPGTDGAGRALSGPRASATVEFTRPPAARERRSEPGPAAEAGQPVTAGPAGPAAGGVPASAHRERADGHGRSGERGTRGHEPPGELPGPPPAPGEAAPGRRGDGVPLPAPGPADAVPEGYRDEEEPRTQRLRPGGGPGHGSRAGAEER
ncbi:hypothetical protein [Streptomyces sp. CAU 1734]|uniref:hypothetical protein n=1 Tax=Streptomyces sp. CAU 1734 TaxID=3140360 RepID=UPI003261C2CF